VAAAFSGVEVRREPIEALPRHAAISIAFVVDSELVALDDGSLQQRRVPTPWRKDYDALDGGPSAWATRFDVSSWQLFGAYRRSTRVGGAVAFIDGDSATLWDLRVAPSERRRGTGAMLFRAATAWAQENGAQCLRVETQTVNVPACRFYMRMGCTLTGIDRDAYPELPGEVRLVWSRST
jgi:streptothricin acetyltransferase